MAFRPQDLGVLAYANGFTLWHYAAEEPLADVLDRSYWQAAGTMLRSGDLILAGHAGADGWAALLRITSIDDGEANLSPAALVQADISVAGG